MQENKEIRMTVEFSFTHSVEYTLIIPTNYRVGSVIIDVTDTVNVYSVYDTLMDSKPYSEVSSSYRNMYASLEYIVQDWIIDRFSKTETNFWNAPSEICNCESRDLLYGCKCKKTKIDWESRCYRNVIK